MSMSDGYNTNMYMPVAPAYGPMNGGYGNNCGGWGGDWSFWIIILFLFGFMGNGWGNGGGWGNGAGMMPFMTNQGTDSQVQRGFDQQAVMGGLGQIQSALGDIAQGQCAGFAGVNQTVSNLASQAEIAANSRQMANMNQLFGLQMGVNQGFNNAELGANTRQMANMTQMNDLAMGLQQTGSAIQQGCEGLKYVISTENCADRAALSDGLRDLTAQGVANTNALLNTINGGIQSIKDQLCQDKIDAKNETIANLRQELAMKDLAASQQAQNNLIQQGFSNEVDQLYNRLNSCPVPTTPVYGRTPIFTCNQNAGWNGCGCGMVA